MNKFKKGFLFLVLLIIGVSLVFLYAKNDSGKDKEIKFTDAKEEAYSVYSKIFLGRSNLEKTEKIDGVIVSDNDNYKIIKLNKERSVLKIRQGDKFKKNSLLYIYNSKKVYSTFEGIADRIDTDRDSLTLYLANYTNRHIECDVPITLLKYIDVGKKIKFSYNSKKYKGKIRYISSIAENNCARVEIDFKDKKLNMLTMASIKLIIRKQYVKDVIAVPEKAIIKSGNDFMVRIDDGTDDGEMIHVEIGMTSDDGEVEIKSGLNEDDIVMMDISSDAYISDINE